MVLINSLSTGNVVDLVFVQNTALLIGEMIPGWMRTGWIEHIRYYLRLSGTVQEEAPVLILLGGIYIFEKIFQLQQIRKKNSTTSYTYAHFVQMIDQNVYC